MHFCVLFFILIYCICNYSATAQHIFYSTSLINNVAVHKDKVFVGVVNKLYGLRSDDLSEFSSTSVGPVPDSPFCSIDGTSCLKHEKPKPTDNYNQLLLPFDDRMLVCGSVRQGICNTHSLSNLSNILEKGQVPVVSNTAKGSTSAVKLQDGTIVVAASYSFESPYRESFPAIALRQPPEYQVANYGSLEGEAAVFVRSDIRTSFSVKYIYSFHHEHFVYFAAVQPTTTRVSKANAPVITKLTRICKGDDRFGSYSEIELQCRASDNSHLNVLNAAVVHDDKLFGAFSAEGNPDRSAICIFAMSRIKLTFWYNIDRCRGGTDSIGLPHLGRDNKCINKAHIPLSEDSCELGVGGTIEALEMAAAELRTRVTSLTVYPDPLLLFAGSAEGEIVQLKPKGGGQWSEYSRRTVSDSRTGSEVNGILVVGPNFLIQMPNAISLLPIAACSQHTSCAQCLLATDPLCKWCHAESKCASVAESSTSHVDVCPVQKGAPVPSRLPVSHSEDVKIGIDHLPQPTGFNYECVFGTRVFPAKWSPEGLICISASSLESSGVDLVIRTDKVAVPIFTHKFTFYDCQKLSTCSMCLSSEFECEWCGSRRRCNIQGTCKREKMDQCMQIEHPEQMIIANGRNISLSFSVQNMDKGTPKDYFCAVKIEGQRKKVPAKLSKDKVQCGSMMLRYSKAVPSQIVGLELLHKQDLIDSTNVTIYDCGHTASDCSSCVTSQPEWGCSWCSGRCSSHCPKTSRNTEDICDAPTILKISPQNGPLEGGTTVTIIGRDLGTTVADVNDRVFVAGSKCAVKEYEISRKIVCVVERGTGSGPVRVSVGRSAKRSTESTDHYSFVDVALHSVYPLFGPTSGGTSLTLFGANLNSGTNTNVYIGNRPCVVTQRNFTHVSGTQTLKCVTPPRGDSSREGRVKIVVDGAERITQNIFHYRPDPIVTSVYPMSSFRSGGKSIMIKGDHFDSVLSMRLFLVQDNPPSAQIVSDFSPCSVVNSSVLMCVTPKVVAPPPTHTALQRFPIGFQMDGVKSLLNLGPRLQMMVVPDPEFKPFKGIRLHHPDQPLIIDGSFHKETAEAQDFQIFIGSKRCYVTVVSDKQLACTAPKVQPTATDHLGSLIGGSHPLVTAVVGRRIHELGPIEYTYSLPFSRIYLFVLVLGAVLIVVLVLLFVVLRKRRTERERDYKKVQLQLEHLESNVRKECKQAFAELQTSLAPCGEDEIDNLHFHPLNEFVNRLLWTDTVPHPNASLYGCTLPVTLAQFDALLSSPPFVLSLVYTAESDPSMCPAEKNLISSLIISALSRNFHYLSEIVLTLLSEHIGKCVQSGNGALLFRRSESLVERLFSKWLSICLYDHLIQDSGSKFYMLYRALKVQSEKGPADGVTGHARYTINESKLLRETVDATPLDVFVMNLDGRGPYTVHLLACDSVAQAKSKILDVVFKGVPHSQRPALDNFDIEWQDPQRGNILLHEESGEKLRRLNTLSSLGVPHQGLLVMMPSSKGTLLHRYSAADSGQSSWSSIDRSSNPYSAYSSPIYHLMTPMKTLDKKKKFNDTIPKSIPEVYLTRLLTSKGTVQKYIDDFLESVLFAEDNDYPLMLKYIFDFIDQEANRNAVSDPGLVSQWKANCWILSVWAGVISTPRTLFDIGENPAAEGNLPVIAQTMMDCFSTGTHVLNVDSPSSRLLFAKDIARLRPLGSDLFKRIARVPPVTPEQFRDMANSYTQRMRDCGGSTSALSELLTWVRGNGIRLLEILSSNTVCVEQRLPGRLSQVINLSLEPEHIYATLN